MEAVTAGEDVAARGDATRSAGLAALFEAQFEPMKRLAFLLGADDPENVAQEAFVRLHTRWSRLRDTDKALPYLRATVANLSRSRLRHLRLARRTSTSLAIDAASAESEAIADHRHGPLSAALGELTLRQRQVVVLRYWLDLSISDVATTVGISEGTVKATLAQSVAKLRSALQSEEDV